MSVYLDFSTIWPTTCVLDESQPEISDFELWQPQGLGIGGLGCVNGKKVEYVRGIFDL